MPHQPSHPLSIHIVRRYGPVGGMENYVYELTQALSRKQQAVQVWCESNEVPEGIDLPFPIIELGNSYRKPRWLAQWDFSRRVTAYLQQQQTELPQNRIIHSHERTSVHHVTTFHGPPFLLRKHRPLDFLSPRIRMWSFLERQELFSSHVRAVLPNSPLIAQQLASLYPAVKKKLQQPAYPGVAERFRQPVKSADGNGMTIGFLGREWKRKGLDVAVAIVEQLRKQQPEIRFIVAGCDVEKVRPLVSHWPENSYELMGWIDDPLVLVQQVDLLLHPARAEPFGMVIAEANAAGLPVIVSDQCGAAALVSEGQGQVCALPTGPSQNGQSSAELQVWVDACLQWLLSGKPVISMGLTWDNLANQHISLYLQLSQSSPTPDQGIAHSYSGGGSTGTGA